MRYGIRIIAALGLVALLVPVAAVAKDARIQGPTALAGAGFFEGEIEMSSAEDQRPVKISGQVGYVGFLDLAGDLKVRCAGKGRVKKTETDAGVVYLCKGRAGQALVRGSHFKFRGQARHYRALFPAGATGTFHGRFVQCVKAENGWKCERAEKPERPAAEPRRGEPTEPKQRGQRPAPPVEEEDEEIPSVDELAGMLDG